MDKDNFKNKIIKNKRKKNNVQCFATVFPHMFFSKIIFIDVF